MLSKNIFSKMFKIDIKTSHEKIEYYTSKRLVKSFLIENNFN